MSEVNLESLMTQAVNTSEMADKIIKCPDLDEADAEIISVSHKMGNSEKMKRDNNSTGLYFFMDILWDIQSEEAREVTQRDQVMVRQSLSLVFVDDASGQPQFSLGGNVKLKQLLDTLGIEGEMHLQEIFDSLPGQVAKVSTGQDKPYESGGEMVTNTVVKTVWQD